MQFDDPIWLEVVRLTHKFFPESKAYIQTPFDLGLDSACDILRAADPELQRVLYDPNLEDSDLYNWIMETASFSPSGRAVVVPECQYAERVPFVCDFKRVAERIDEGVPSRMPDGSPYTAAVFDCGSDTFVVFESGEAFLADHHEGVCWAHSKINAST